MFEQVKFVYDNEVFGGIAKVDDEGKIYYVICGCCGCIFDTEDIVILKQYHNWVNISDEIIGED